MDWRGLKMDGGCAASVCPRVDEDIDLEHCQSTSFALFKVPLMTLRYLLEWNKNAATLSPVRR